MNHLEQLQKAVAGSADHQARLQAVKSEEEAISALLEIAGAENIALERADLERQIEAAEEKAIIHHINSTPFCWRHTACIGRAVSLADLQLVGTFSDVVVEGLAEALLMSHEFIRRPISSNSVLRTGPEAH